MRARSGRAAPSAHEGDGGERPAERRRAQLAVLADIAAQASMLQPAAEAAVAACGCPGTVPDDVALELGRASRGYSRFYETARYLPVEPELNPMRAELTRVLSYHLHFLRDAGDLAFSGRPDARTEPFRRELAEGLGDYATTLLVLAGQLRKRLESPDQDEPTSSGSAAGHADGLAPGEVELDDVQISDLDDPER